MRTKTLLLSAAALLAGLLSTQAQNVYSANIVGYYNLNIGTGYNLVANQFTVGSSNGASEILPSLADGTFVYAWNGTSYTISIYDTGGGSTPPAQSWYMSDYSTPTNPPTILPGQGVFVQSPSIITNTVVGTVVSSNTVNLVTGYNMVGSTLPIGGVVNNAPFNLNPPDGTFMYTWNATLSKFDISIYDTGGGSTQPTNSWYMSDYSTPTNAPSFSVGQGTFLQLPSGYTWTQVLTNN